MGVEIVKVHWLRETYLSAHKLQLNPEFFLCIIDEPLRRIEAVLRSRWERVLGC